MKNQISLRSALITAAFTITCFSITAITSCKKEKEAEDKCKNVYCLNGGTCSNGACICPTGYSGTHCEIDNRQSFIQLKNNAPTPVEIELNSENRILQPGATTTFSGVPGNTAHIDGLTHLVSSGVVLGENVVWSYDLTFPPAGQTKNDNLDVGGSLFFLKVTNVSSDNIQGVYVNYSLTAEKFLNVIIPKDGNTYSVGYFQAFSNSSVRAQAQSTTNYWSWSTLGLTGSNNQVKLLQAN